MKKWTFSTPGEPITVTGPDQLSRDDVAYFQEFLTGIVNHYRRHVPPEPTTDEPSQQE